MMRRNYFVRMVYACLALENLGVLPVCHLVSILGVHFGVLSVSAFVVAIPALPIETPSWALLFDCVDLHERAR